MLAVNASALYLGRSLGILGGSAEHELLGRDTLPLPSRQTQVQDRLFTSNWSFTFLGIFKCILLPYPLSIRSALSFIIAE
jgi:hypothetical protein